MDTKGDFAPTIIRIVLGVVLFPHGAQKLLGWFGGAGFADTMDLFIGPFDLPWIIGLAVILLEFFGSLLLIIGLGSRLVALAFIVQFTSIIFLVHLDYGFFMNWSGRQLGEGFEYHLLVIGMSLSLLISGAGKFSIDSLIKK
nr:DoxX family protein [Xanthovirga aplysinae]